MSRPRYRLDAVSLSYRSILRDVSCSAHPSELLAIVGPSGAGKTSLLSLLAAVSPSGPTSGRLLLNGVTLNPAKFRRLSGHVTQDDALFPLLTVRESLTFSARLRLPLTPGEADVRVRTLLADLSLETVADSRIGALSGGERRRVSIGSDLVHHPQVLLLDEPTSGLDSASALHIISMLKSMAVNHGKTVILTIHQPGFRILDLVDRLLLISAGSVKHFGPLNLLEKRLSDSGLSVPPHVNVLEFAMDKINTLTCCTTSTEEEEEEGEGEEVAVTKSCSRELLERSVYVYANSRSGEILILTSRFFKNVLRTQQLSTARMLQCLFAGLALGTIFMNVDNLQARIGFFAFTLTFLLSSTTEGLPVFLQERRILTRETSRGAYRVSSYVVSNALVFLPFLLLASLLYAAPVYWLVGLRRELDGFLYFSLVVWMVMAMANSFVACFSALVPNFIMGNSLIAGFMGSFFLFSGYFISKRNIPKYWIFMHYMSLFKYPFEGFVVNEYGCGRGRSRCLDMEEGVCVMDGATFLTQRGLLLSQKWTNLGVMMGFICGYRVLCFLILWLRCCSLRRR